MCMTSIIDTHTARTIRLASRIRTGTGTRAWFTGTPIIPICITGIPTDWNAGNRGRVA
ncbi:protein of unknown function (plasmid) [Methylocella tundrae]|uniref:Uncharacterized protein n=1 Tax=Methylocella tundrae TaxID=227605 RepID=A0A4U8Z6H5_METTU|nr:protein of unknown function [Methylocella tundrae]